MSARSSLTALHKRWSRVPDIPEADMDGNDASVPTYRIPSLALQQSGRGRGGKRRKQNVRSSITKETKYYPSSGSGVLRERDQHRQVLTRSVLIFHVAVLYKYFLHISVGSTTSPYYLHCLSLCLREEICYLPWSLEVLAALFGTCSRLTDFGNKKQPFVWIRGVWAPISVSSVGRVMLLGVERLVSVLKPSKKYWMHGMGEGRRRCI